MLSVGGIHQLEVHSFELLASIAVESYCCGHGRMVEARSALHVSDSFIEIDSILTCCSLGILLKLYGRTGMIRDQFLALKRLSKIFFCQGRFRSPYPHRKENVVLRSVHL